MREISRRETNMPVTLISGCSTGIGRACAVHFASKGHRVYATMRNPGAGEDLMDLAHGESLDVRILPLDVNVQSSVDACLASIMGESGAVDVLINNAGILGGGSIEETDIEVFRANMETNYVGSIRMIKAVLPVMRAQRSGAIVNISSVWARAAMTPLSPYAASKAAIDVFSDALAQEVRPFGIRVHVMEPGIVATPMVTAKGGAKLDPGSPYAGATMRVGPFMRSRFQDLWPPELVAQAIDDALTAPVPKLRHAVGWDAQYMMAARARMTDEEWADFGLPKSEDEIAAFWRDKCRIDPVTFQPIEPSRVPQ
jgi:NAD(P)-dependent dehydrogenase (short-subunit alcohol dehydrogenase family)